MTLARRWNPQPRGNVYVRVRNVRFAELAENIGKRVFSGEKWAVSVHRKLGTCGESAEKALPGNTVATI